jgi:hypothetical protein
MAITKEEQIMMASIGIQLILAEAVVNASLVGGETDDFKRGELKGRATGFLSEARRYYVSLGRALGLVAAVT